MKRKVKIKKVKIKDLTASDMDCICNQVEDCTECPIYRYADCEMLKEYQKWLKEKTLEKEIEFEESEDDEDE